MPRRKARFDASKTTGLRAVIYLRVSTRTQVDKGYGLDAQLDICEAYAEKYGYEIVDTKQDRAISGTKGLDMRKGLDEAINLCLDGKANVFLCAALDRQSRDTKLFNEVRDLLKTRGISFITVKEGMDLTLTRNALMGDILAAFAAEDRRRIATRTLDGRIQKSKINGRGSSYPIYGYKTQVTIDPKDNETIIKKTVINQEQAEVVRHILKLTDEGVSYRHIAAILNNQGILTSRGFDPDTGLQYEWKVGTIQRIVNHRELYMTGKQKWTYLKDNEVEYETVESAQQWPIICQN